MKNNLNPVVATKNSAAIALMPYLVVLSTSLVLTASNIFMPSLPQMAVYFKQPNSALLLAITFFYIGFASSGFLCGILADRFGRRSIMITGFITFIIGCLICLFSRTVNFYIAGSFLEGIGGAAPLVVGLASIQDLFSAEESTKILSKMGIILGVMPSLSPIVGGYLALISWRANYIFLAFLSALLLFFIIKYYLETFKPTGNDGSKKLNYLSFYAIVISNKKFLRFASLYPLLVMGSTIFLTVIPFYLINKMGFTPKKCGYLIGFMTFGYSTGAFVATQLVARYGMNKTLNIGSLLSFVSGIFLILSFLLHLPYLFFVGASFCFQSSMSIVHPPSTTIAVRCFSDLKAVASAVRGSFSMIGSALGATIAALLTGNSMIVVTSIVLITACLVMLLNFYPIREA